MKPQTIQTKNTTFVIEKLAQGTSEHQYLRELLQNSIEAQATRVNFDIHWPTYELTKVPKLAVIDNGIGMTADQMLEYLGKFASSGKKQSIRDNYGIGAKVTALVKNPYGLIYQSWVDGVGHALILRYDVHMNQYVIGRMDDGSFVAEIDASDKPTMLDRHGTRVILLGRHENDNTWLPEGKRYNWIGRFLNNRYFGIPDHVEVYSSFATTKYDIPTETGVMRRRVLGAKSILEKTHTDGRGIVTVNGANIHWFIRPVGEMPLSPSGGTWIPGGIGSLWRNEIYDWRSLPGSFMRQSAFGIFVGNGRIVLYVQPNEDTVVDDPSRQRLMFNTGEELPWSQWGQEFAEQMPEEVSRMIDEELSKRQSVKSKQPAATLQKYLDRLEHAYLKPNRNGKEHGEGIGLGGKTHEKAEEPEEKGGRSGGTGGATALDYLTKTRKQTEEKGNPSSKKNRTLPEVHWVPPDEENQLDGKLARWIPNEPKSPGGRILANIEFTTIPQTVYMVASELSKKNGKEFDIITYKHATKITRDQYELMLLEIITRGLAYVDRNADLDKQEQFAILAPEGLTSAGFSTHAIWLIAIDETKKALKKKTRMDDEDQWIALATKYARDFYQGLGKPQASRS